MDDSGLFEGLLAGSAIALLLFVVFTVLPLFLLIAVLVRYFQATGDIRKMLHEVQDLRTLVEADYREKYLPSIRPAPPEELPRS